MPDPLELAGENIYCPPCEKRSAFMWKNIGFQQCLAFINCQLRPGNTGARFRAPVRPTITISRMTGSGGRTIASQLVEYLQARAPAECHWTAFDRNLLERTLEEHHLPKQIAEFMPEAHKPMLGDMLEELLGMHPSSWTLVQQTSETILRLAQMGHVVLVGRGSNVITRRLPNVFHVRLVGSLERRVRRVEEVHDLDRDAALKFIHDQDKGKARYVKEHFKQDINDPLLYHLIINTDRVSYEDAARLIADAVIHRFQLETKVEAAAA